ncbi:transcription elongation factor spt4 [Penicillium taxi]|uniref:transcription elongation factor spt4 n=1 Tax=Penicillium taxi TaxID=168475 RepID=UPI00254532FC|nr:transcription elongation factor spt4 [Penicillium taxi]KAJ5908424.1 transcription elongation factor spt4 [Penicillium taxi]
MSSFYVPPNQQRNLRACMVCAIVQTQNKFNRDGCPNCETIIGLRGNLDTIGECTSQVFEGLIVLHDPASSWVARWQRLENYIPGTYATKVTGSLSDEVIGLLEDSGVKYVPRDGSSGEDE